MPAPTTEPLETGRTLFQRRAWAGALRSLRAADDLAPLGSADLDLLAKSAYLSGHEPESIAAFTSAFQLDVDTDPRAAARTAFWLGFVLTQAGRWSEAGAWLERGTAVLDRAGLDGPERGLLLVPLGLQRAFAGDGEGSARLFARALDLGREHRDPDLLALARLGTGRAALMPGMATTGEAVVAVGHLDEVMLAVTAGEVTEMIAGLAYCAVIDACRILLDVRRAQEWTAALTRWCEDQPELVPYRGQCLVHRAQVLQLHGAWADAAAQARLARERLSDPPGQAAAGAAWYQEGELHRLRGEWASAEEAYQRANAFGHQPQPGHALLLLARGEGPAAAATIARILDETIDPFARPMLLGARVTIALQLRDTDAVRAAADELVFLSAERPCQYLAALAGHAVGAAALAGNDAAGALAPLRAALSVWASLDAPYEQAGTRELIGLACRELADDAGAALELGSAAETYVRLGAVPDAARIGALLRPEPVEPASHPLSVRETEVLRLISAGHTNRAIATALHLSEKTVARHVGNILTKLDLPSRSAATAWAYEHGVIRVHGATPR
ncbi:response regulator transcription factor [Occultella gossypii]|uniref:Response regulator transcription factor n=1 Tax=Occultella gossypii TaxID=2800820 RepID=A0ABS7SHA2_9MICO|nr:response regulator transcription factor [Occultella gossypii]MBZ2198656.1 response regulator transcription factor [Occultella gossypii]